MSSPIPEIPQGPPDDFGNELQVSARGEETANNRRRGEETIKAAAEAPGATDTDKGRAVRIGLDVTQGLAETISGRAPIGGALEATKDIIENVDSVQTWFHENGVSNLIPGFSSVGALNEMREEDGEDRVFESLSKMVPQLDEPESVTGGFVRGMSRFLTAFAVLRKPSANMVKTVTGLDGLGAKITTGAVAGIQADLLLSAEQNLSNFIQGTALANPVTEFLAIKEDDPEINKRLKSALEGMALGAFTDVFFAGLRGLRAAHIRRVAESGAEPKSLMDSAKEEIPEITEKDIQDAFGANLKDPLFRVDPVEKTLDTAKKKLARAEKRVGDMSAADLKAAKDAVPSEALEGTGKELHAKAVEDGEIFINFNRINSEDDIKKVLKAAGVNLPHMAEGTRKVRTHEQVAAEAAEGRRSLLDILNRKAGNPLSDVDSKEARDLLEATNKRLLDLTEKAASATASPLDQVAFRKAMVIHNALLEEVLGARRDAGRALAAWRMDAEGSVERAMQMNAILNSQGGAEVSQALAIRLKGVKDAKARAAMMNKGMWAKTKDAVVESFALGLLWGPKTHLRNMGSNTAVGLHEVADRYVAEQIGKALGGIPGEASVAPGEAAAMAFGTITAMREAFIASVRRFRTGESAFAEVGGAKIEARQAISADIFGIKNEPLGRGVDFLGKATRLPGEALGAEDEFFKIVGYRAELAAQAHRQSVSELGLDAGRKALADRRIEIIQNPPDNIRLSAVDAAAYRTFTQKPGWIAEWFKGIRHNKHGTTRIAPALLLPYVNTPANIFRYGFEHSPLAPLVGQWRAEFSAGGARQQVALARAATGAMILSNAFLMAADGQLTGKGPEDRAQRDRMKRQGWQQYGVFDGELFHSLSGMDQYGAVLGFAAEANELYQAYDMDAQDYEKFDQALRGAIAIVSHSTLDRSFTTNFAQGLEVLAQQRAPVPWLANQAAGLVPFSSAFRTVENVADPAARDRNGIWDGPRSIIAGLSSSLPKAKNVWGEDLQPDPEISMWAHAISPSVTTAFKPIPIEQELARLQFGIPKLEKQTSIQGVPVDFHNWPHAFERYQELAGNDSKSQIFGLGAKDFLNAIVSGDHQMSQIYKLHTDGHDGGKASFIRSTVADYRRQAQVELLDDPRFSAVADYVHHKQAEEQRIQLDRLNGN